MDYELAEQLKDAGFPQGIDEYSQYVESDGSICCYWNRIETGAYIPTLEELIEACGDDFGSLYQGGELGWVADKHIHECEQEGKTTIEAVARLYLALNKKS